MVPGIMLPTVKKMLFRLQYMHYGFFINDMDYLNGCRGTYADRVTGRRGLAGAVSYHKRDSIITGTGKDMRHRHTTAGCPVTEIPC